MSLWEHGRAAWLGGTMGLAMGGPWVGSHWGAHGVNVWVGVPHGGMDMDGGHHGGGHGEVGVWVGIHEGVRGGWMVGGHPGVAHELG